MTRDEFVKQWGDKYLGIVSRAAALDKGTAMYARWLALQVNEVDAWLGSLFDARDPGTSDSPVSLDPPTVEALMVVRAVRALWAHVFEPTIADGEPAAPMNRLPAALASWLAVPENRKAVTAWLNERVRERQPNAA